MLFPLHTRSSPHLAIALLPLVPQLSSRLPPSQRSRHTIPLPVAAVPPRRVAAHRSATAVQMSRVAPAVAPKARSAASTRSRSSDAADQRSRSGLASPVVIGSSHPLLPLSAGAAAADSATAPSTPPAQGASAVVAAHLSAASSSSAPPLPSQRPAEPTVAERIASDRDGRLLAELITELVTDRNGKFAIADSAFDDWSTDDVKALAVHLKLVIDPSALSNSRARSSLRKWMVECARQRHADALRLAQEQQARLARAAARTPAASSGDEDSASSASDVDSEPMIARGRLGRASRSDSASSAQSQSASARRPRSSQSSSLQPKDLAALIAALERRANHPMEAAPSARNKSSKGSASVSSRSHADVRHSRRRRSSSSSSDASYAPPVRQRRFDSDSASDSESSGDEGAAFDVDAYADGTRDATRSRHSERSRREEVDDRMPSQRPMAEQFMRRALAQGAFSSLAQAFTAHTWKSDRNKNECLTLARALDHLRRKKPRVSEAVELLSRRLAGVDIADDTGNWAICQALEGGSSHERQSLVPEDVMRGALKSVVQLQAIQKTAGQSSGSKSSSSGKGHSGGGRGASRSTHKKDGAGGGQGKRDYRDSKPSSSSGPSAK